MSSLVGERIKVMQTLKAQSNAKDGVAEDGVGVDRTGFHSAVLAFNLGAASGTPTSYTAAVKLQESDDNASFSDVSGQALALTDADEDTLSLLDAIDLRGLKQYIRATVTVTFTGGTSPEAVYACNIILGDADAEPVSY